MACPVIGDLHVFWRQCGESRHTRMPYYVSVVSEGGLEEKLAPEEETHACPLRSIQGSQLFPIRSRHMHVTDLVLGSWLFV